MMLYSTFGIWRGGLTSPFKHIYGDPVSRVKRVPIAGTIHAISSVLFQSDMAALPCEASDDPKNLTF